MACDPQTVPTPGVTRIPIAGPAPFNTLVCCTYTAPAYPLPPNGEHVFQTTVRFSSPFCLGGYAQSNPAPHFVHTTSAWLCNAGPGNGSIFLGLGKDDWLLAVDRVAGCGFDNTGCFFVDVDIAEMHPNPNGGATIVISITSNILVTEPQPRPPHHGRFPPPRRQL